MTTSESSKASGQGGGARAITRGDEARVREAVRKALGPRYESDCLEWWADGHLLSIMGLAWPAKCDADLVERLATEGIVPGPAGWCWAAAPAAVEGQGKGAPPAWLAAFILAALPPDGRPIMRDGAFYRGVDAAAGKAGAGWTLGMVDDALDAMTANGEVEYVGDGAWRRPLPKPAPSPSSPQPEGRPASLRAALLAVLTPGPVHTLADLLPALDAAMGERAGVAVATGAEAMKAAREVGARVDGVEWSLPPIPDGWGWRRVIASRWYLARLDASDPEREAVASLAVDDGVGGIGGLLWRVKGEMWQGCESVEEGQAAALTAARLAGLFAAPRAEAAPVATPAPTAPLDALARRLCGAHLYAAGSPGMAAVEADVAALTPLLAAWGASLVGDASDSADPLHRAALAVSAARQRLSAAGPGTDEWSAADIEVARTTGALLDAVGVDVEEVAGDARHAQRIAENERDEARSELAAMEQRADEQRQRAKQAERVLAEARFDLITAQEAVAREVEAIKRAEEERDAALAAAEGERQRVQGIIARAERVEGERDAALHNYSRECALSESLRSQLEAAEDERDEALAERTTAVEARMRAEIEEEKAARERDAALATIAKIGAMLDPVLAAIAGGREAGK